MQIRPGKGLGVGISLPSQGLEEHLKILPKSLLYSLMETNTIDFALISLGPYAKHVKKEKTISLNQLFITEVIILFFSFLNK